MSEFVSDDPLTTGFFSVRMASELLDVQPQVIRGWMDGCKAGPVVDRDFKGSRAISFLDLMELRFIEFFRAQKVSMHTIRLSAQRARSEWNVMHPFALSKAKYLTDRRKIFAQTADENGDKPTWELASGQHEMWEAIESVIARGIEFDPATQLAKTWRPRAGDFPNIIIDPMIAFGRPVVEGNRRVPTGVLFEQWKAEGQASVVADWFEISEEDVETAIKIELSVGRLRGCER